ncbi:PREDICTED: uncharacterized protein LOC105950068 [Erythranthe guttata]|uniref:uncharacterized protein LOC105950068 n=1 Tax=Erythranthe guttata TaxID=4155 RepID=UPI00064DCB26|nr:PREDICTED: uncharacterized protein LOC105950068 [Erythranthe guttata]|eukprot:XP_012828841.1 PREDICTED: uncharacterized protein LOC105950068 [Erythranthe guttata]
MIDAQSKEKSKENLDPSSYYYFHHSDNSSLSLSSQLLNGENWATWSKSVEIAFSVRNKLGFIDGRFKKPSKATHPEEYHLWERANHILISWFSHFVSSDLIPNVLFAPTAQHVWEDFRARFSQGNLPRIFEIKQSIASHVQGTMSVANYFTKLRGYWDELDSYRPPCSCDCCKCDEKKIRDACHNEDRLMQFLMGLNDSYKNARGQILLLKPVPDIREAYNMVTQEEKQREVGNGAANELFSVAAAMRTSKVHTKSFGNSYSKTEDHFCHYCKKDGHNISTCHKLHGFPLGHPRHDPNFKSRYDPQYKSKNTKPSGNPLFGLKHAAAHATTTSMATNDMGNQQNQTDVPPSLNPDVQAIFSGFSKDQIQQLTTAMASMSQSKSDIYANAADSGATDHITSDSSLLVNKHTPNTPHVNLPTDSTASIHSTGTIYFNKDISLKDDLATGKMIVGVSKVEVYTSCHQVPMHPSCIIPTPTSIHGTTVLAIHRLHASG